MTAFLFWRSSPVQEASAVTTMMTKTITTTTANVVVVVMMMVMTNVMTAVGVDVAMKMMAGVAVVLVTSSKML